MTGFETSRDQLHGLRSCEERSKRKEEKMVGKDPAFFLFFLGLDLDPVKLRPDSQLLEINSLGFSSCEERSEKRDERVDKD